MSTKRPSLLELDELFIAKCEEAGIYEIRNQLDNRVYVGQAVNIRKRWHIHLHYLNCGTHCNRFLQRSWEKHGFKSFKFTIIEKVLNLDELDTREQYHMDLLRSCDRDSGFNLAPASKSNLGVKYSEESKLKMSKAQKGKIITPEARTKISATLMGRKASPDTIEKRRLKLIGKKRSESQIKTIRESHRRRMNTPMYEAFGKSQTIRDWAEEYRLNTNTLKNRILRAGMAIEVALTQEKFQGKKLSHIGKFNE